MKPDVIWGGFLSIVKCLMCNSTLVVSYLRPKIIKKNENKFMFNWFVILSSNACILLQSEA